MYIFVIVTQCILISERSEQKHGGVVDKFTEQLFERRSPMEEVHNIIYNCVENLFQKKNMTEAKGHLVDVVC